ncbi:MAG TPA: hypothetical protein VOA87_12540 [Thermoanaerobaculia bacterium]|nr:hypothetical protein [Thermoanaerobaculia bacterium]
MQTLVRNGFTRRTLVLVLLLAGLATSMTLLLPKNALAICCGWEFDTTYYSDPGKTHEIGYCDTNVSCSGTNDCPGPTSPYFTRSKSCCDSCLP